MNRKAKDAFGRLPPEPPEPFPIPPNPLLAAMLTSSKPEMETKIIVNSNCSTNC